uniref:Uncharacterized protein n=1 Tax=Arundo donax TaxID=35708 RepID=A0A0A9GST4_ARUDO
MMELYHDIRMSLRRAIHLKIMLILLKYHVFYKIHLCCRIVYP